MRLATLGTLLLVSFFASAQDNTIWIRGNILNPGPYPVVPASTPTLRTLVERAGGLIPGWLSEAYLYRTDQEGKSNMIKVPLSKILNRKAPDITLKPGDEIYIPGVDQKPRRMPVIDDRLRIPVSN
jgi:polysaccharide biosynthesis/export protein